MKANVYLAATGALLGSYGYAVGSPYTVLSTMKVNDKLVMNNKAYIIVDWHLNTTAGVYAIYVRAL